MKGFILLAFLVGVAVSDPCPQKVRAVGGSVRSPVGECPEHDPANPVYLPDDKDCGYYYECSNGCAIENNCSPGLEFSPTLHVCTEPSTSGCTAPNHQSTDPPPATTALIDFDDVDFDEVDFYDVVGTCPPHDTNDTIYLPDNKNCTIYYVCSNGRAIPLVCPPTMEFSPSEHVCVLDIDSDCKIQPGNGTEITGHQGRLPKNPVGECPPHQEGNPTFLPDSEDCQYYYECSNGLPIKNTCADGLVWNPKLNTCVLEAEYDCKTS